MTKETYSLNNPAENIKIVEFLQCSPEAELVFHCAKYDKYNFHFYDVTLELTSGSALDGRRVSFFGNDLEKITKAREEIELGADIKLKKLN